MSMTSDLVDIMREFHADRKAGGVRRKYERMAEGAFEFFRGTNFLFARAWPTLKPLSSGPAVWLCGDLHLENFGAFPTDDGDYHYDINDFDESVVAPCSIDLVRCSTSILLAADSWHLTPMQGTGMVLAFLDAYRQTVLDESNALPDKFHPDLGAVAKLLDAVRHGSSERMLAREAKQRWDGAWRFRRSDPRVKDVGAAVSAEVRRAVEEFGKEGEWRVVDIVKRYSGIGSLGLRRYQVLVRANTRPEIRLMSLKEAAPSVLRPFVDPAQPVFPNEAARVVAGQRQLQGKPTAGLAALEFSGRSYRLRAMIPDENRSSLNRLQNKPKRLREAVAAAGRVTAESQRRGSRFDGEDRFTELRYWVESPGLDAVLAAAVRFADWVSEDYRGFLKARRGGNLVA